MNPTVADWMGVLDGLFPPALAEAWDSVGLQAGDRAWPAGRVLVALDPTFEVVREAADRGGGLLVAHHPLVFRPLASVDLGDPVGRIVGEALAARMAVAACHTNADAARPGVTEALAEVLGVDVVAVLRPTSTTDRVKLVSFTPSEVTGKVLDALALAGAGVIGEYTHCTFRVRGTGTFLPSERADPAVGDRGALNEVEEDRLEVVVPTERLAETVEAMIAAHPYEEVAYDVYATEGPTGLGVGRVGRLTEPVTVADLAQRCRE